MKLLLSKNANGIIVRTIMDVKHKWTSKIINLDKIFMVTKHINIADKNQYASQ